MVRGEAVNNVQVLPQRLHVLTGAKHGAHLRSAAPQIGHVVFAEEEMVRGHLTRDVDPLLLGGSDDQDLRMKQVWCCWNTFASKKERHYEIIKSIFQT